MSGIAAKSTRRAFFVRGGAALGAGVATTVAAAAPGRGATAGGVAEESDLEAIRRLHLTLTTLIQSQSYEEAASLFDENASLELSGVGARGKLGILQLFAEQYRHQQAPAIHSAYRQSARQLNDSVTVGDDRRHATATFHMDVEVCVPLQEDCTAAQMARLQGQMADRRWESGRFEAAYVKRGEWKVSSLRYLAC
jgi:hypothetical protein